MEIIIAIPILNEEKFILSCLESVKNFTKPINCEVKTFILDGGSSDETLNIVNNFINKNNNFFLKNNPKKIQPAAMNMIIANFDSDYLMRLDAHCIYPIDYLEKCLETSIRTGSENVGGVLETLPSGESLGAKIVQNISSNFFGVGGSGFRVGMEEGETDTVPFGFFSKDAIHRNGFFDEELVRAQDFEYNKRIKKNGGSIWINPNIKAKYFNQKYYLKFLTKLLLKDGPYNAYMWFKYPYTLSFRHLIPSLFFLGNIFGIILSSFSIFFLYSYFSVLLLYFLIAHIAAVQIYMSSGHIISSALMPIAFFLMHISYGAGEVLGAIKILLNKAPVNRVKK
jgi:glycosyltransferase involved in cell wall biosynthesis